MTSADLQSFKIIDEIVPEPIGGAHRDAANFVASMLDAVDGALRLLEPLAPDALREARYRKYRRIGAWQEDAATRAVSGA